MLFVFSPFSVHAARMVFGSGISLLHPNLDYSNPDLAIPHLEDIHPQCQHCDGIHIGRRVHLFAETRSRDTDFTAVSILHFPSKEWQCDHSQYTIPRSQQHDVLINENLKHVYIPTHMNLGGAVFGVSAGIIYYYLREKKIKLDNYIVSGIVRFALNFLWINDSFHSSPSRYYGMPRFPSYLASLWCHESSSSTNSRSPRCGLLSMLRSSGICGHCSSHFSTSAAAAIRMVSNKRWIFGSCYYLIMVSLCRNDRRHLEVPTIPAAGKDLLLNLSLPLLRHSGDNIESERSSLFQHDVPGKWSQSLLPQSFSHVCFRYPLQAMIWTTTLTVSCILGFFLCLCIEFPISAIFKLLAKPSMAKSKQMVQETYKPNVDSTV